MQILKLFELFKRSSKRVDSRREVSFVPYAEGDRMLKSQEGWELAPEEDANKKIGYVYLERYV